MSARSPLTAYGNVRVGPTAMSIVRSLFSPTAFLLLEKSSFNLTYHFRPTRRGCFFRAKAQKKSTPDGAAKACLHDSRNTNHFGWVGQSVPSVTAGVPTN
jgi:hypothetical protein